MSKPDIPYDLMERILRNSQDRCAYCDRDFKQDKLRRVFVRWLINVPLYDPRNTTLLCQHCHGFWEWVKRQIAFGLEER